MSRTKRSWTVFKRSLRIIRSRKTLMWFPVVISLLMCLVALFFIVPIAFWESGHGYTETAHGEALAQRWVTYDADHGGELCLNPLTVMLENGWVLGIGTIVWLLGLMLFAYLVRLASQVYVGALYVYATEGVVPRPFAQDEMDVAWKVSSPRDPGCPEPVDGA